MKYTDFVKDFSFQKYKSAKFSPAALEVFRIQVNTIEPAAGGKFCVSWICLGRFIRGNERRRQNNLGVLSLKIWICKGEIGAAGENF